MNKLIIACLTLTVCAGCTTVSVKPVDSKQNVANVCIEENPAVIVSDFLSVVQSGFDRHGINTNVVSKPAPEECENVLTYTAFQNWDLATYMHHAELKLNKDGQVIGSAEYHLTGKGGLSLAKFASTKTKMDPVIDQLLANVVIDRAANASGKRHIDFKPKKSMDKYDELLKLDELKKKGIITDAEFDAQKQKVLGEQ